MKKETKVRSLIKKMVREIMDEEKLTEKNKYKFVKKFKDLKAAQKFASDSGEAVVTKSKDGQWNVSVLDEAKKRDYKAEYKKYGSSTKAKKYRAELNAYNRKKGTYGNGDGKDASHKGGKISGFEKESVNRGRAEKSRLKKEQKLIEGKFGKFDTGVGAKGNGLTMWDRNQTQGGDYKTIAHISDDGKLTIRDKNVKKEPKLMKALSIMVKAQKDYWRVVRRQYEGKLIETINKLNEKLSKTELKKMRDKFIKTGKLPPHLKKLADLMDKHKDVKNIVVPGLEWMSKLGEAKKRDYKDEYKKFQSSDKSKKYRAELNAYNRKKGTYGNGDGKDASHKGGKIVGFEKESVNRGRAEKSRLKKEEWDSSKDEKMVTIYTDQLRNAKNQKDYDKYLKLLKKYRSKLKEGKLSEAKEPIFTKDDVKNAIKQVKKGLKRVAPYLDDIGTGFGGKSIIGKVSLDKKRDWSHGILQNSRWALIHLHPDGTLDSVSMNGYPYDIRKKIPKLRKSRNKSLDQAIDRLEKYFKMIQKKYPARKDEGMIKLKDLITEARQTQFQIPYREQKGVMKILKKAKSQKVGRYKEGKHYDFGVGKGSTFILAVDKKLEDEILSLLVQKGVRQIRSIR